MEGEPRSVSRGASVVVQPSYCYSPLYLYAGWALAGSPASGVSVHVVWGSMAGVLVGVCAFVGVVSASRRLVLCGFLLRAFRV